MKCVNENCNNKVIDFTGNTDGRCARCKLIEMLSYFSTPTPDTHWVSPIEADKQALIDYDRTASDYADERN